MLDWCTWSLTLEIWVFWNGEETALSTQTWQPGRRGFNTGYVVISLCGFDFDPFSLAKCTITCIQQFHICQLWELIKFDTPPHTHTHPNTHPHPPPTFLEYHHVLLFLWSTVKTSLGVTCCQGNQQNSFV